MSLKARGCGRPVVLCYVPLNTVLRFAHRAGDHAQAFHDQMVQHVQVKQVQADEAWAFVGKKDKHCNPADPADRNQAANGITFCSMLRAG